MWTLRRPIITDFPTDVVVLLPWIRVFAFISFVFDVSYSCEDFCLWPKQKQWNTKRHGKWPVTRDLVLSRSWVTHACNWMQLSYTSVCQILGYLVAELSRKCFRNGSRFILSTNHRYGSIGITHSENTAELIRQVIFSSALTLVGAKAYGAEAFWYLKKLCGLCIVNRFFMKLLVKEH